MKYILYLIIGWGSSTLLVVIFGPVHPVIAFILGFTCTVTSIYFGGIIR